MENTSRYAVYYAPAAASSLAQFAAAWLGWNPETATAAPHTVADGLPVEIADITASPRKYGFHATLKAPFRLASGCRVEDLQDAVAAAAKRHHSFEIPAMEVANLGGFLALTPRQNSLALVQLAEDCVRALDPLCAPATEGYLARRRAAGLSQSQDKNLRAWGYPYVMEDFRFHMTLTGALPGAVTGPVLDWLRIRLADTLARPLPIREICLFCENADGFFRIMRRYPLAATQP